jgi:hypothetical protein
MEYPGYKMIPTPYGIRIAIPDNLPPEEEAALIAKRLAELDPVEIEQELRELQEQIAHPERSVPFEKIIRDLELMNQEPKQS